jgi:hypothetical protein
VQIRSLQITDRHSRYTAQIFLFAQDSLNGALIGLNISQAYGVAVCVFRKFLVIFQAYAAHPTTRGFKTTAKRTSLRGYPDVISEVIIVSRSTLVQTYVIIIVIAVCVLPFAYIPQMVH